MCLILHVDQTVYIIVVTIINAVLCTVGHTNKLIITQQLNRNRKPWGINSGFQRRVQYRKHILI